MTETREYIDSLVSIIVPIYNSERFLVDTIESVRRQTYMNWELILVDDSSSDRSREIMEKYARKDIRIRSIFLEENSGAAVARNQGLKATKGRYIAYLDADDLWMPEKLEKQLLFMNETGAVFTCCDYEKIEQDGTPLNKTVRMPQRITYKQLLRNTIIQTVGVMVDTKYVDISLLEMPNVRRGQDSATWLQMLRNGIEFRGQNEVLAVYRRVPSSLSSNKLKAMKRTWNLYRRLEHLSIPYSIWCLFGWAYHGSLKRIYIGKFLKLSMKEDLHRFACQGTSYEC